MTTKPPSRTADQFVLRLPDGMRDRIAEAAKANNRSMNAEIVARLSESLSRQPPMTGNRVDLRALVVEEIENYLNPGGKALLELLKNLDKPGSDSKDS